MSGNHIVEVVEPCAHGHLEGHAVVASDYLSSGRCPGGSRRTLTEGDYILIEKVDGEWPLIDRLEGGSQ